MQESGEGQEGSRFGEANLKRVLSEVWNRIQLVRSSTGDGWDVTEDGDTVMGEAPRNEARKEAKKRRVLMAVEKLGVDRDHAAKWFIPIKDEDVRAFLGEDADVEEFEDSTNRGPYIECLEWILRYASDEAWLYFREKEGASNRFLDQLKKRLEDERNKEDD